jgi:hypothetical protein
LVAYKTWNVNGIEGCSNRAAIYTFGVRIFYYLLDIVPRFVKGIKFMQAKNAYLISLVTVPFSLLHLVTTFVST